MSLNIKFIDNLEMDFTISVPQCENCNADICVCPSTLSATQNINDFAPFGITGMNQCSCNEEDCICFLCGICNIKTDQCQCELPNEVFTPPEKFCDKCSTQLIGPHSLNGCTIYYDIQQGKKLEDLSLCPTSNLCPECDKDKYHETTCFACDPNDYHDDRVTEEYECKYCYGPLASPDQICGCYLKAKYGGGAGCRW